MKAITGLQLHADLEPQHIASRIPSGHRGDFIGKPFGSLPRNTMYDEPFEVLEDDNKAYVAMELGLVGMDPVDVLIAFEEGDLEAALVGIEYVDVEMDHLPVVKSGDEEIAALVERFAQPKEMARTLRTSYYKGELPKPAKGYVAPLCYDHETRRHVLGHQAKVIMRKHRHYDPPAPL